MAFKFLKSILPNKGSGRTLKIDPVPTPSNLYLALYARLKHPNTYHYALHISPQDSFNLSLDHSLRPRPPSTTKHQCKNILQSTSAGVAIPWIYEAVTIDPTSDSRILVRVLLAELSDSEVEIAERVFRELEVRQEEGFNCVTWVREALEELDGKGIIEKRREMFAWEEVERAAVEFVERKKRDGRWERGWDGDGGRVATWDFVDKREIVP